MMAVLFEVTPQSGQNARYLEAAASLRDALATMDGFVSVERFQSLSRPGAYLSLSYWRDEAAVRGWRNHADHRAAQALGRAGVFASYRIRVVQVVRDYTATEREQAPADSTVALGASATPPP